MGKCWKCDKDVFLREEETRCDNCKEIVRYKCNTCNEYFDVEDKESRKKVEDCKWCWFYRCPHCSACSPDCSKFAHAGKVRGFLSGFIPMDKWGEIDKAIDKIVLYFEDVKMGKERTECAFGVPKTYAKHNIKSILARMKGFKVRDVLDQDAFEKRQRETLNKEVGEELTIGNSRDSGSYGQEYRDVFNLCVCLGGLKYEKKKFKNEKDIEIEYDSWIRVEKGKCPHLDMDNLIVKDCPQCKKVYERSERYCKDCVYLRGGKKHVKGSSFELRERLSNNPTCRNLGEFKKREGKSGGI